MGAALDILTPTWAEPLLFSEMPDGSPVRYKAGKGGRASGKSHFFGELAVEEMLMFPSMNFVCVREIQKSLKYSAKRLIEGKIAKLRANHFFHITNTEISRRRGSGIMIFQGMQDHTADSIKSLEGFHRAWIEEGQNLSDRSLKLLRPTIFRNPGAQLWASWNPDQPTDAIEKLLCAETPPPGTQLVHVNYDQNPFLPESILEEVEYDRLHNQDSFDHVWLGGHNKRLKAQIFSGKWRVDEFEPGEDWQGPYHGLDFGFSSDPLAAVRLWIHGRKLFVEREAFKLGLELDDTPAFVKASIPGAERFTIRADNARPESISHLKRKGLPKIVACKKGKGSVEDGIEFIRSFEEIVIHQRCVEMQREARLYSYKIDKASGDVMTDIEDQFNHGWDAVRYALEPLMRRDKYSWAGF